MPITNDQAYLSFIFLRFGYLLAMAFSFVSSLFYAFQTPGLSTYLKTQILFFDEDL